MTDAVSLQVIGAGFGRTGTLSLKRALEALGLTCYHMTELMGDPENRRHLKFWDRVAMNPPGRQHPWQVVFERYGAALDFPACCVWRELHAAFPDTKVILTVHPEGPDAWYDSTVETIYRTETSSFLAFLSLFNPRLRKFRSVSRTLIWQRFLKGTMGNKSDAIRRYEEHVNEVKALIPSQQLLVYSVDQGWDPLCRFLGREVPDRDFPFVNRRAQTQRQIGRFMRWTALEVTLSGAAVFALLVALFVIAF